MARSILSFEEDEWRLWNDIVGILDFTEIDVSGLSFIFDVIYLNDMLVLRQLVDSRTHSMI